MTQWILHLMLLLVPASTASSSFPSTAAAIDRVAHEVPIYDGEDGPERTAAELVAVAYYESGFDPDAVNHDLGGDSLGLEQINSSNLAALRLTREQVLDPETNLRVAAKMMRWSHRTCRGYPWLQQLASYASGRGKCDVKEGVRASVSRLQLANKLLNAHHPFWASAVHATMLKAKPIAPLSSSDVTETESEWVESVNFRAELCAVLRAHGGMMWTAPDVDTKRGRWPEMCGSGFDFKFTSSEITQ